MYSEPFLTLRTLLCCARMALRKGKSVKNAHKFASISDENSHHYIGTIMIVGGILEGVWPINN